jgi:hypothetical protein
VFKSIEGIYRDGKVELLETPPADAGGRVIVTFLAPQTVQLGERGIDPQHAAELRQRLKAFSEDWDRPEMDVYDAS